MATIGKKVGKKAAKATAKHSVKGVAAKAQRRPLRSLSLLIIGGVIGATAGWFVGRKAGGDPATS